MLPKLTRLVLACGVVLALAATPTLLTAGPVEDQIRAVTTSFAGGRSGEVGGAALEAEAVLPGLYEKRDYAPVWFGRPGVEDLFGELNHGIAQGFHPGDFHLPLLFDLHDAAQSGRPQDIAAFDVVATDAAITLIHHVVYGKVDPAALDSNWNFARTVIQNDPADVLNDYLDGEGFSALMRRIDIDNRQYADLVDALARYRAIALDGGWPMVPDDTVLKPGMSAPAVAVLRKRLAVEGGLTQTGVAPVATEGQDPILVYDDLLAEDVRLFQARHGLQADGVVGGKTFASLNRPVADRIDQLRLSLERGRWLMREVEDEFVLVNIAGARTFLVKADGTVWTTRSVTGSAYRQTPVFRDEIQYMEFNPTWTVPNSIFRKDKLAKIRKDPGYLARNNYYVVRTSDRKVVSASSVNWNASNPGVTLVQRPGPNNALGAVKFMFPNKFAVYLHDTNDRSLFDRNERNLSSGCVRLEHPFEFANLLMEGDPEWSQARMQAILDSAKTTRVDLPKPMPVLLTYWTAWVEGAEVHFREDPYQRDGAVLKALNR
ncbi:L,D-transpeptidase family protein [Phaeobacter marinintestinus]|uniref:L,D-transpeptidase family protein n=1 Tax=Falsiphaeobacter marinintestinus TaxID=1492905 RepID=UPI0011B7F678|nr:L,D-transpeptidase family protein [Phaeobacter marinintestinus]